MNQSHPASRRVRRGAWFPALLAALAVGACGTTGPYVPVDDFPQPAADGEYRIARGDTLAIRVWNQEAMSSPRTRVREDGKISVPFLQDVEVAGSTPAELSQLLQTKLKTYVVNRVVTVTVEELRPLRVSVVGEVARAGQYDLEPGAGVLAALAAAGGLTDYAHRNAIYVIRNLPEGKGPVRIQFRYASLVAGDRRAVGFRLLPNDVVTVQ